MGSPAVPLRPTLTLGVGQMLAWGSSTYLPAMVAAPLARELGLGVSTVFAVFSYSLLVMAALGPAVGRAIDRWGGRQVLCLSNLILGAGLALLATCQGLTTLMLAWTLMGAGMALGLYDAAFSALVRLYGMEARKAITGVTLLGGFASTVAWPLTAWWIAQWDWRIACAAWATLHLVAMLPAHAWGIPALSTHCPPPTPAPVAEPSPSASAPRDSRFLLVATFGAASSFITWAMSAHLPGLLMAFGVSTGLAISAAALLGPAQVVARLLEYTASHRFNLHPLISARGAALLHPAAASLLLVLGGGPWTAMAFASLHGAGNGALTIAKGTLPLALFGAQGYGARQGVLAVSQRIMQAAAPVSLAVVLEHWGPAWALSVSFGMSLIVLASLFALRAPLVYSEKK